MYTTARHGASRYLLGFISGIWLKSYAGSILECVEQHFLDQNPLRLERQRKLQNLNGNMPQRIVRLQLILNDVKAGLRTTEVDEITVGMFRWPPFAPIFFFTGR